MQQLWNAPSSGQVVVDDFRHGHPDRREEDPLCRLAEPRVLLRRLADDDRRIDRIAAHRDGGELENGERLGRRVVPGVVAERPLLGELVLVDVALEHDLGVRGHLQVDGLCLHELHRLAAQEPGEHELVDVLRQRRARGIRGDGVEPEGDGDLDPAVGGEIVRAAVLVDLPVHRRGARAELLHAVHADIARSGERILRDHRGERDERRGIVGPTFLDREQVERRPRPRARSPGLPRAEPTLAASRRSTSASAARAPCPRGPWAVASRARR